MPVTTTLTSIIRELKKPSSTESCIMRPVVRYHTFLLSLLLAPLAAIHADEPKAGESKRIDLGNGVTLEVVYLPPGEFMMGSTPEEKKWATGIEGGAQPGTERESYEGEKPRLTRVRHGV